MAHTNSTTHYSLPQFVTTDKPAWLTDINGAFSAIDTAIYNAKDAADDAQADATQAGTDAGNALTTANAADAKGSGAVASIADAFDSTATYAVGAKVMYNSLLYTCSVAVTTPGAWTGSANWTRTTVKNMVPASAEDLPVIPGGVSTAAAIASGCEYNNNDTITASINKLCAGRFTSAGDKIIFFYPVDKQIKTTSCNLTITTGSYAWNAVGNPIELQSGTYAGSVTDGGLTFTVTLSVAISAVGNRVGIADLATRTLTFHN